MAPCYPIGLAWLPISVSLSLCITQLTCATGSFPPESCIFSLGITLAAAFAVACVYIWHVYADQVMEKKTKVFKALVDIGTLTGLLSSIGLSVTACFQVSNVPIVHYIGAGVAFSGAVGYMLVVSVISSVYLGQPAVLCGLRWLLSVFGTVAAISFLICRIIGRGDEVDWIPDPSLFDTMTSVNLVIFYLLPASEWTLGLTITLFFLLWVPEFLRIDFQAPLIKPWKNHDSLTNSRSTEVE
ncbi:DNA damage-regulated autophagy modulator protein 2 [Clonorchis sinensis]|uniref:DNA damage-regulated autophagy modulator protein 2 n=1 Tax=Clonorchis sinensis TaxID=79923 RepID=A0A8T1MM95_CLOSI|nr:DNA damage-regulated autophagy modulator protein 2 [Clonorchis sinensis]